MMMIIAIKATIIKCNWALVRGFSLPVSKAAEKKGR